MIKTTITPIKSDYLLNIPSNYIGKELEIFIYAKDEITVENNVKKSISSKYKGILTKEEADNYQLHITNSRLEWERDI